MALITIDYPPARTSAAVQMRDLAHEFQRQGHRPVVIVPDTKVEKPWRLEEANGVEILRVRAKPMRDIGHVRRTINERQVSYILARGIDASPFAREDWDIVVWYSPTIFFGPFIRKLKRRSGALAYLILRDIFPEWAVDLGVLRKGPAYWYFKRHALFQYKIADVIGVQTESNLVYLSDWCSRTNKRLEVLHNWQHPPVVGPCSIRIANTVLSGRTIFCYIGNMGLAQGMDVLVDLAARTCNRSDIGFLFVGRGSEVPALKRRISDLGLTNVLMFGEIPAEEIPGLLAQCHVGLLALHPNHKSHNIPGKFLSYLRAALPVLASVNAGTDLQCIIENEGVGRAFAGDALDDLYAALNILADDVSLRAEMSERCTALADRLFSPASTVRQIVGHLISGAVRPTCSP
ncbi:glycosyltransferase family 4 protein [Pseudolabrys sp.]|uniref:glycosyltransferase family 4 protein n=1 Tax=Pseudolabrys sp. TaxID=1960880 RepID=UPI003D0A6BB4